MKSYFLFLTVFFIFSAGLRAQNHSNYLFKDAYGHSYKSSENLWEDRDNDGVMNYYDRHDQNPNVGMYEIQQIDYNSSYYNNYNSSSTDYSTGRTIYEGPRGGQYYINSNGNKTYIRKKKPW